MKTNGLTAIGGNRCFKSFKVKVEKGSRSYRIEIPPHRAPNPALPKLYPPPEANGEIAPFRYTEISGHDGEIKATQTAFFAPFNDSAASFKCSNEKLSRIWDFCKYSIKATSAFGIYIDGERERLPYEGDMYINQLGHFCCDNDYSLARRTIDYLFEHPTWPTEWSLIMVPAVFDYYLYSGDSESVERWKSQLYQKLCLDRTDGDGLISDNGNDIVDWPQSERDGYELSHINLVPNCYLYHALKLLQEDAKASVLRESIRRHFFRNGLFVDSSESNHNSLHGNMFALLFGLAEKSEYPAISDFIRERGMACSVYGAQFLLETCFKHGLEDHAVNLMTSDGLRSWLNMLKCGATITMEAWDDSLKPNQDWNHAWGTAPLNIITRFLMGIRPMEPGFRKTLIQPRPASLTSAEVTCPTPHGGIKESFTVNESEMHLKLEIPSSIEAQLFLPRFINPRKTASVFVNGKKEGVIDRAEDIFAGNLFSGTHEVIIQSIN